MSSVWKLMPIALIVGIICSWLQIHQSRKKLLQTLSEKEEELRKCAKEREAERKGRVKAQQELRKVLTDSSSSTSSGSYPMTPVGHIRSCFTNRNGTPRQPLLVPLARARLDLPVGGVPAAVLEGLSDYSHCWLIYVFHENTDLPRLWRQTPYQDFKAKVRVPRLDGLRMGVFATRSPHRPLPIGLSVARIETVEGRSLLLSGVDLVDGTPILDVKPYLPFADSVPSATVPHWVQTKGEEDPLYVASVTFRKDLDEHLDRCWNAIKDHSLYMSSQELKELVSQVLSRDIRSVFQRRRGVQDAEMEDEKEGVVSDNIDCLFHDAMQVATPYSLVLEGVKFRYSVDSDRNVVVTSVELS